MVNNWLITGGCGFLGLALIKYLRERNQAKRIRVFDNLTVGSAEGLGQVADFVAREPGSLTDSPSPEGGVELVQGDIRDADLAAQVCRDMDVVVHLAASTGVPTSVSDPRFDLDSNVLGTFNLLDGARQNSVKRFLFISSSASIDQVEPPLRVDLSSRPVFAHSASELAAEGCCCTFYRAYGMETVALRYGDVYGPGTSPHTSVVTRFIKQALNQEPIAVFGDARPRLGFIYITDLADAIVQAALRPGVAGQVFQVAGDSGTTGGHLTDLLTRVLLDNGVPSPRVLNTGARPGEIKRNHSNSVKAETPLPWQPEVDLETGLRNTITWFLEHERNKPIPKVVNLVDEGKLGGPHIRLSNVALALKEKVHTTVVLPRKNATDFIKRLHKFGLDYQTTKLTRIKKNPKEIVSYCLFFPFEVMRLRRLFISSRCDIVHLSGGSTQYKGAIAGKLARKKVIWHLTASYTPWPFRWVFGLLSPLADGFIFASKKTRDYYSPHIKCTRPEIIIPAPVDIQHFSPDSEQPDANEAKADSRKTIIGTVAHVSPVKGLDTFIRFAAENESPFAESGISPWWAAYLQASANILIICKTLCRELEVDNIVLCRVLR